MANRSVIVSFVTKLNSRGIKAATKDLKGFEKLSTGIGARAKVGFAIAGVAAVAFAEKITKIALKAAIAEEKQVKSLSTALGNLGKGFEVPAVLKFADQLQRATGVSEDILRPSLQRLITVTGDVAGSQELLKRALDISKGSGRDLDTVVSALSRAFSGNLTSLGRLNVGLDKNLLKSGDVSKIMDQLNQKFGGQGAAAAATMQGSLDKLSVSASEAAETLGQGIFKSVEILGGKSSDLVGGFGKKLEDLAGTTSSLLAGIAGVSRELNTLFTTIDKQSDGTLGKIVSFFNNFNALTMVKNELVRIGDEELKQLDEQKKKILQGVALQDRAMVNRIKDLQITKESAALNSITAAAQAKVAAATAKKKAEAQKKDQAAAAKTKEQERQERIKKDLANKFDLELINIAAAKRRGGSAEDMALLDGLKALKSDSYKDDETAIIKLTNLEKVRTDQIKSANEELANTKIMIPINYQLLNFPSQVTDIFNQGKISTPMRTIERSFEGMYPGSTTATTTAQTESLPRASVAAIAAQAQTVAGMQEQVRSSPEYASLANQMSAFQSTVLGSGLGAEGLMGVSNLPDLSTLALGQDSSGMTIVVNVAGSVSTEQDLVSAIATGLNNLQRSGQPITLANQGR